MKKTCFSSNFFKIIILIFRVTLDENNQVGEEITTLQARDLDAGDNGKITYHLSGTSLNFAIDSDSGTVYALKTLDAEKFIAPEVLEIIAEDSGMPVQTGKTSLRISIKDFNDNIPVFNQKQYTFSTVENVPIDSFLGKVEAFDGDLNPTIKYKFYRPGQNFPFAIDENSGEIFVAKVIDFELTRGVFNLTVLATDEDDQSDTCFVAIEIIDLNDNSPIIEYPLPNRDIVWINPKLRTGQLAAKIQASDRDDQGNGQIIMTLENTQADFVNINSKGEILLQRDLTSEDYGRYSMTVRVRDQGEPVLFVILRVSKGLNFWF